jgi:hypothetical protein
MPVIKDCKAHVDVPKWRIGGYDHDICNFHQGTELWIGDNYGSGADLQMTFGRGDVRAPRMTIRLSPDQVKSFIAALSKCI